MKPKQKSKLAGSHQKCWLWGRHLVTETVTSGRWIPRKLILSEDLGQNDLTQLKLALEKNPIPVEKAPPARLKALCRSGDHQGFLAQMPEFEYESFEDFLKNLEPINSAPLLILDRIQDPHNFGAMLRSAEVLGACGVIIGQKQQVGVTTAVARASAGAVNHLSIVRVDNLLGSIHQLSERGFQITGTSLTDSVEMVPDIFKPPVGILIGNEATGVAPELLDACHERVRIPQSGRLDSLNAAVATGIMLYAASPKSVES
ncbi:MAG: 23S rRNA (guanosine(2251)-2'-O)-methyltransferase RlmB [Planctomycetaceae bacterium]|nr:23S rRNA (guanosine(2251)-2'-O)-methyltransferase RlmB [Planctomycetaceae bacterium]